MKREFPVLYERVSVWIATPLLAFGTMFYTTSALSQPASAVYPVGMAAFGVTAALSGICFTMVSACDNPSTSRYAGEKFLHSSLLLIQSLLVLYVRDAAVIFDGIQAYPAIITNIKGIAAGILSLVTTAAAWTWYHGFSDLNAVLWKNWERRIREINEAARDSSTSQAGNEKLRCESRPPMTKEETMARFGGNEFIGFSVPLVFKGRYFILESGNPTMITVFTEQDGRPVFEVLKNQPVENAITAVSMNPTGIVTVADKGSGIFLYKIRPGSETSVAFGKLDGGEISARISDRSIQVGGCTLENNRFNGNMAGVVVGPNDEIGIGASIPPLVLQWLTTESGSEK